MAATKPSVGEIYRLIERTLIDACVRTRPDIEDVLVAETADARLDLDDDALFRKLVMVVFYSGFRAATVTAKKSVILGHLGDWRTVQHYTEADIDRIAADEEMIGNKRKIAACVANARTVARLAATHGSFGTYLRACVGAGDLADLLVLKEDLEAQFEYLGGVTVYHFMTDLGLDVLKPDRVIMRIFHRLGLVEGRDRYFRAIQIGQRMAAEAGVPIRRIDRVLVAYGQVETEEFGLKEGICLEDAPKCGMCGAKGFCPSAVTGR